MLVKSVTTALKLLVILDIGLQTVLGQATGAACRSRIIPEGVCVHVQQCPLLIDHISTLFNTLPAFEVIAQYGCGTDSGGSLRICCPNSENIPDDILRGSPTTEHPLVGPTSALGCGQRFVGDRGQTEWPFVAAIGSLHGGDFNHFCTGVFIHNRWVVAGSHCYKLDVITYVIPMALYIKNESLEYFRIIENYKAGFTDDGTPSHNLVLLKLERSLQNSDHMQTICLPNGLHDFQATAATEIFAGWKSTNDNEAEHAVTERVWERPCPGVKNTCLMSSSLDETTYRSRFFCTNLTQHDERPDIVVRYNLVEGRYYLHGVEGYGIHQCFDSFDGRVYTDITNHLRWINCHILRLDP